MKLQPHVLGDASKLDGRHKNANGRANLALLTAKSMHEARILV